MVYSFKHIFDEDMYRTAKFIMVFGKYNFFNNIVIDGIRKQCEKGALHIGASNLVGNKELYSIMEAEDARRLSIEEERRNVLRSLGYSDEKASEQKSMVANLSLSEFMDISGTPCLFGKWFCSVDLKTLNQKGLAHMKQYMKKPRSNGVMVVHCDEFKIYREYLRSSLLVNSLKSHMIQLSFPNFRMLTNIVHARFSELGVTIRNASTAELFVLRMGSDYDMYDSVMSRIAITYKGEVIDYNSMLRELKDVANYKVDNLLEALIKYNTKPDSKVANKVLKIYRALLSGMEPSQIVKNLRYKVQEAIEYRLLINSGIVPVGVAYSVESVKSKIGEKHKLYKVSDHAFTRNAEIASRTSLGDWQTMLIILNSTRYDKEEECERVLYEVIMRGNLTASRLYNIIGLDDVNERAARGYEADWREDEQG